MARRKLTAEQFVQVIESKMRAVVSEGRKVVRENGEYGAELVRDTVETSGTMGTGKRGRIDTGKMLSSVDSNYSDTSNGGEAVYGFVKDAPEWTRYQELGTQYIEPMQAVPDAHMNVEVDFRKDIENMMRKEW